MDHVHISMYIGMNGFFLIEIQFYSKLFSLLN